MAFPVIRANSATGSDTGTSGAGPATAIVGTGATSGAGGTTVTITDAVDLSGVATDGSAVLYFNDTTTGHRRFDQIIGISGSSGSWTVTVANGYTGSVGPVSWAIGGVRASIGAGTSLLLTTNNNTLGDAMPGWTLEMQSAHNETLSTTLALRRNGDQTSGPITLRGAPGAAVTPLLTFTNNSNAIQLATGSYWVLEGFELQNTSAAKGTANAIIWGSTNGVKVRNVKISHPTNFFAHGIYLNGNGSVMIVENCTIGYCSVWGVGTNAGNTNGLRVQNCLFLNNVQAIGMVSAGNAYPGMVIRGNVFAYGVGNGIFLSDTSNVNAGFYDISNNVFHGNTDDAIEIAITAAHFNSLIGLKIENNHFTSNGGCGVNMSGSGMTDSVWAGFGGTIRNNNFWNNVAKYNGITATSSHSEQSIDPSGGLSTATTDYAGVSGGGNFMSSLFKGLGYPLGGVTQVGVGSGSYNYQDIGLQHQDSGGGAILARQFLGMAGGS